MPLNEGASNLRVISYNLAKQSAEAMAAIVNDYIQRELIRDAANRVLTDLRSRSWHEEKYGGSVHTVSRDAQERLARSEFDIPTLTETPIDRWMDRIRGVH